MKREASSDDSIASSEGASLIRTSRSISALPVSAGALCASRFRLKIR